MFEWGVIIDCFVFVGNQLVFGIELLLLLVLAGKESSWVVSLSLSLSLVVMPC